MDLARDIGAWRACRRLEDALLALILAVLVILPLLEMALRRTAAMAIPGALVIVQHMTLAVTMLGAAVAAREGKLAALSSIGGRPGAPDWMRGLAGVGTALVASMLALACWILVQIEWEAGKRWFAGVPAWTIQWVMPIGFALIALRALAVTSTSSRQRLGWFALAAALACLYCWPPVSREILWALGGGLTVVAAVAGSAVFASLGAMALLWFWGQDLPIAALAVDLYRLVTNPVLPALPLFALTGFLLAEGQAARRLVGVFEALFGVRGLGVTAVTAAVLAGFAALTGTSGVVVLTLGVLFLVMLKRVGHSHRSALGLVTSAGALGVLLPPSLPLILYGVVAKVPLHDLFIHALPAAFLLILLVCVCAWWRLSRPGDGVAGVDQEVRTRPAFWPSIWAARWELALPVISLWALLGGWATIMEAAALTAALALVLTLGVHREISVRTAFALVVRSAWMVGGVLLLLGVALGLTNVLADAQVPDRLAAWAAANIESKAMFLLLLNLALLLLGCVMDVFSAVVVVVPLLLPLAALWGVDPIHLGIIFLANMELGFITPPVGMNLMFAAQRFNTTLHEVTRATWPYGVALLIGVLIITYAPELWQG